ncbi:7-methylguanosine phosphate-specific 5'-nucleotidase [Orussus abietinus]|uniref:7-methylguanosine phosphate-specific 5'-nucleotidase n=1 Tax=Orussus abietinus TaxID=222816 RepID=UPI0006262E7C|nr:7-methylguanosine phosphate-specific 5'-nucleotidase [Orussus abietinus]
MKCAASIEDFPVLKLPHVYMKDEAQVLRTINRMIEAGSDKLQVITDFDLTCTKQHVNGKPVLTSFGIFGKCTQLPVTYAVESKKLYKKYRPIEIDPELSVNNKTEAMNEWMVAAEKLLCGFEFDSKELAEVAKKYGTALRDGTKDLFEKLFEAKVPILVFSAGLGDVVEAVLKDQDVLFKNVKVISNFLKYDGRKLNGFQQDRFIHVFNKNEHAINGEYFQILEGRGNVLLMGDSIGDANMADGVKDLEAILRIGFLYDHAEASLPAYMEAFDIVLVDDQTMNVSRDITKKILE